MKKILTILLCLFLVMSLVACGGDKDDDTAVISSNGGDTPVVDTISGYTRTDGIIDGETLADGRYVNGYQIAFLGDKVSTAWFDFTVKNIEFVEEYEGYTAEAGTHLAVAEIYLENTFGSAIPIFYNEFWLTWGIQEEEIEYAEELAMFMDGVKQEDSINFSGNKTIKYLFSISDGAFEPIMIEYLEFYSDDVYGNTFYIIFEL